MPIQEKMDRDIIDWSIIEPLMVIYNSLPKEDAIAALAKLINLPIMDEKEKNYPPLSPLFQNKVYQTKEIQSALKALSEIMHNPQPQDRAPFEETHNPVHWGKFNLLHQNENGEIVSRSGANITARDVHDYMRYKFAIAAFNIIALQEAKQFINDIKKNADKKNQYYKHLAEWVSEDAMPEAMRELFLSDNILKQKIITALKDNLSQKDFQIFLPYLDKNDLKKALEEKKLTTPETETTQLLIEEKESKTAESQFLINTNGMIDNLFLLGASAFDREMEAAMSTLLSGFVFDEEISRKLTIFEKPPYKAVHEKLQEQLKDPGEYFSPEVILSFVKVAETREILNLYGNAMKVNHADLFNACEQICRDYVHHLETTSEEEQIPLTKEKLTKLNQVLENVKEFIKEKEFIDWTSNVFALYFQSDQAEQDKILEKILYFVFDQKRIHTPDNWLHIIYQHNLSHAPEEKEFINIEPYHINRVFLHALTMPIEDWTPAFYDTFGSMLDLLESSNSDLAARLKRDSYPPEFIAQLRWLQNYHACQGEAKANPEPPVAFPIPVLYYPDNANEFARVLRLLSPEKISAVIEKLKTRSPQVFRTVENLKVVLGSLNNNQQDVLLTNLKDQLPDLIQTMNNFYELLRDRNFTQKNFIIESIKDVLPSLIMTPSDLIDVLSYLNPAQRTIVFESIKNDLSQFMFQSTSDFKKILSYLAPNEKIIFYEKIKNSLAKFIKTPNKLFSILDALNPEQRADFFETLKNYWPKIIINNQVLHHCLESFREQKDVIYTIYESLESQWPMLITTKTDLDYLGKFYDSEQRTRIANILLIHNLDNYMEDIARQLESITQHIAQQPQRIKMFFHSQQNILEAILMLKHSLNLGVPLDKKYIEPLSKVKLKEPIIEAHLKIFRPEIKIKQFLEMTMNPQKILRHEVKK